MEDTLESVESPERISQEGTPMETIYTGMHVIDRTIGATVNKVLDEDDAYKYIADITNKVLKDVNHKQYKITSMSTEVVSIIKKVWTHKNVTPNDGELIAQRLLRAESEAQEKVQHLDVEIKKGSLIQSFFKANDMYYYLISKIESNEFLDDDELIRKSGLPYERKALKSCLFILGSEGEVSEIYISDTNRSGTDYWHNSFLELEELTSDESNTKKIYVLLTNVIAKELKSHPTDHLLLRNQILGYFKTQPKFVFSEAMDYIFGNYIPEDQEVSIEEIKQKINNKMESKNYDKSFTIKQSVITQRMWKLTQKLNEFSELNVNGHDASIKSSIFSRTINGEKYILIKTTNEEAFNTFNWENN